MVEQLDKGFPFTALDLFLHQSGLPTSQLAELLQLPPRTLIRRRASGRLNTEESERLLRVATLFDQAVVLFEGDVEAARAWLLTPRAELDQLSPLDFARTEIGAREVEDLIGRLEQGVFT